MSSYHVEYVEKISKSIQKKMQKDLIDYESSHGIDVNYHPFALILRNKSKDVIGVLQAYTAFAEIYVDDLWVDQNYRSQGYGRSLLDELEKRFKGKGFNNINLVTSAFQAPKFYEKCGFSIEFVRENKKNPQLTKFFLIKYFDDEIQTQGLL